MHTSLLSDDDLILSVIDTPGLFDSRVKAEFVRKEIVNCVNLAKDGIHAVLVVYSLSTRFSSEEAEVLDSLKALFGNKISDFMIVVFTGGDVLKQNQTLEDYLGLNPAECPDPLKEILDLCKNRYIVFDDRTRDEKKHYEQVKQLLSHVNDVVTKNSGQPYTKELLAEGHGIKNLHEEIRKLQEKVRNKGRCIIL